MVLEAGGVDSIVGRVEVWERLRFGFEKPV